MFLRDSYFRNNPTAPNEWLEQPHNKRCSHRYDGHKSPMMDIAYLHCFTTLHLLRWRNHDVMQVTAEQLHSGKTTLCLMRSSFRGCRASEHLRGRQWRANPRVRMEDIARSSMFCLLQISKRARISGGGIKVLSHFQIREVTLATCRHLCALVNSV